MGHVGGGIPRSLEKRSVPDPRRIWWGMTRGRLFWFPVQVFNQSTKEFQMSNAVESVL